MDYEKKYNDALDWMRKVYPTLNGSAKEDAEHYFPELKESEDERIRRMLIEVVNITPAAIALEHREEMLAYLEKQKEQKPVEQLGGTFTSYDMAKTFTEGQNYVITHPEKFGLCKPAEWSEKYIADIFEKVGLAEIVREQGNDKLTNAVQAAMIELSKGCEWSEEDENKLYQVMEVLLADKTIALRDNPHCKALHRAYDELLDWLKSLRPQPHWKPSEEQIGILGKVFAGCQLKDSERDSMVDLFYHLKDMI